MKILVIGQGGREHALVKALKDSHSVSEVHCAPGSDGIALIATCHKIPHTDLEGIKALIQSQGIEFVVVGPEQASADGLGDFLRSIKIPVFGVSKSLARLESSKIFAKKFMVEAGVPTARFFEVSSVQETLSAAKNFEAPYVLKADGLCAGKGVVICKNLDELSEAAEDFFEKKIFGEAGSRALLEEFQPGWEMSYHILTNGKEYEPLPLAQDHKRLFDGDRGPNTGGMGTVAPLSIEDTLHERIKNEILFPTVQEIGRRIVRGEGFYNGVVFIGIMVTPNGPKALEYNVRFGDPETQVLMPLLKTANEFGWAQVLKEVARGQMPSLKWKNTFAACIIGAAEGYPEKPISGVAIEMKETGQNPDAYILHAGTKKEVHDWKTNGGRVLNFVGVSTTLKKALENAYSLSERTHWKGKQVRMDIGQKILTK